MEPQQPKDEGAKDQGPIDALVMSFFDLMKPLAIILLAAGIIVFGYLIYNALFPKAYWQTRELEQNLAKWESQHVTHYRMRVNGDCFFSSPEPRSQALLVEVKDNQVISVADWEGNELPPQDELRQSCMYLLTIPGVFSHARTVISEMPWSMLRYDPQFGYPADITYERWLEPCCDIFGMAIKELQVLP